MNYRINATSVSEAFKFTVVSAVPNKVIENYYWGFRFSQQWLWRLLLGCDDVASSCILTFWRNMLPSSLKHQYPSTILHGISLQRQWSSLIILFYPHLLNGMYANKVQGFIYHTDLSVTFRHHRTTTSIFTSLLNLSNFFMLLFV
jgi:hypothetical protein